MKITRKKIVRTKNELKIMIHEACRVIKALIHL